MAALVLTHGECANDADQVFVNHGGGVELEDSRVRDHTSNGSGDYLVKCHVWPVVYCSYGYGKLVLLCSEGTADRSRDY